MRRIVLRATALLLSATTVAGAGAQLRPPGPQEGLPEQLYAVALESGSLRRSADVSIDAVMDFAAGQTFTYYGVTDDAFGRPWSAVGDPEAWARRERWYALAGKPAETLGRAGLVSVVSSLPAPRPLPTGVFATAATIAAWLAVESLPIRVGAGWWDASTELNAAQLGRLGEVVGVGAYRVPAAVASEAIELLGGLEALGPWPEEPTFGRLHVPVELPIVFRYGDRGWAPLEPILSLQSTISVLGNPLLEMDATGPLELSGRPLPCWELIGSLDPTGRVVGRLGAAAAPGERAVSQRRPGSELLGLYDMGSRAWPVAPPAILAPRQVQPESRATGVAISDNSRRQAAYIEQTIDSETTARLRGRAVRLQVMARAAPADETISGITVSLEIVAGSLREAVSGQVGPVPTPVTLTVTIPADAESITVRLIPLDRSVAVQETAGAVFDSAALVPAEWPQALAPEPLLLRRVQAVVYVPAPRYTRADLAVAERSPEELTAAWRRLVELGVETDEIQRILAGEISPGMSEDIVRLAWGQPEETTIAGAVRRLDWADRSAAFDVDGRVLAWTRDAEPVTGRARRCVPAAGAGIPAPTAGR